MPAPVLQTPTTQPALHHLADPAPPRRRCASLSATPKGGVVRLIGARTVEPASLAEVRAAMLDTAGPLLFRGGGTKLEWGARPAAATSSVIASTALTGLLTYDAADATVSVQAGMPLADLQGVLAEHNQWLAVDPPHGAAATVGGIFAANDFGPSRLAYGTMRDLVIGATYVLADGSVGRTGGHVIKNVAGYDMAKLLCGSLGTLAFVAELVLRVHPRPRAARTLRAPADAATAARVSAALGAAPIEPAAVEWAEQALWIRLTGHPQAVAAQVDATRTLLDTDAQLLTDHDEQAAWQRLTAALAGHDGQTVVRGTCFPSQLPQAADGLVRAAQQSGIAAHLQASTMLGVLTARLAGGDARQHAACVATWRDHLRALGGTAVVRRRVAGTDDAVDVWGPPPSAIGLLREVKRQLDPDNRCAPGRFVGGI